jgi:peptidoglycan/xylan/chitin deacetylase (PgdA/CDA1 family)
LKRVLGLLGIWHAVLWLDRVLGWRFQVIVLLYHNVSDPRSGAAALSDLGMDIPVDVFQRHVEILSRWFRPISMPELERVVRGEEALRADRVLITFDDAFRGVRDLAAPCLKRRGMAAHVFVPTGFIDSGRRFWWTRLTDALKRITAADWRRARQDGALPSGVMRVMWAHELGCWDDRRAALLGLEDALTRLPERDQDRVMACLESFAPPPERSCLPQVSWAEMREMQGEGFTFGAHSHSHPCLTAVAGDRLEEELRLCAEAMERELGSRPRSFAYPFGDFDAGTAARVAAHGFHLAFTIEEGGVLAGAAPPLALPRMVLWPSNRYDVLALLAAATLKKYLASRSLEPLPRACPQAPPPERVNRGASSQGL